jgi:hypothetical protein
MFALVTWAYRQGDKPPAYYLKQMGLWDLDKSLERIPTMLVEAFQTYTKEGAQGVGRIGQPESASFTIHTKTSSR